MKITRAQYIKWNKGVSNGFHFDSTHYCLWGEKTLKKIVNLEGNEILVCRIAYRDEYFDRKGIYGDYYEIKTGKYIPVVVISRWALSGEFYSYKGNSKSIDIGSPERIKRYALLKSLTDDADSCLFSYIAEKNLNIRSE